MDGSLTNLFDSLNKPLIHENKFDLTQKINDNFKDILNTANRCYDSYTQNIYSNDYSLPDDELNVAGPHHFKGLL